MEDDFAEKATLGRNGLDFDTSPLKIKLNFHPSPFLIIYPVSGYKKRNRNPVSKTICMKDIIHHSGLRLQFNSSVLFNPNLLKNAVYDRQSHHKSFFVASSLGKG